MDETYYREQLEARDHIIASLAERNRQLEVALEEAYAAGARKVMPAAPPPRRRHARLRVIKGGLAAVLGAVAGVRWLLRAHRAGAVAAVLTAATGAGVAIPVILAPMSGPPGGALALRPAHHLRRGRPTSPRVPSSRGPSRRPGGPVVPPSGTVPASPRERTGSSPAATAEATVSPGPSPAVTAPTGMPTRAQAPSPSPTVTITLPSPSPSPTRVPPGSGCTLYVLGICLKL